MMPNTENKAADTLDTKAVIDQLKNLSPAEIKRNLKEQYGESLPALEAIYKKCAVLKKTDPRYEQDNNLVIIAGLCSELGGEYQSYNVKKEVSELTFAELYPSDKIRFMQNIMLNIDELDKFAPETFQDPASINTLKNFCIAMKNSPDIIDRVIHSTKELPFIEQANLASLSSEQITNNLDKIITHCEQKHYEIHQNKQKNDWAEISNNYKKEIQMAKKGISDPKIYDKIEQFDSHMEKELIKFNCELKYDADTENFKIIFKGPNSAKEVEGFNRLFLRKETSDFLENDEEELIASFSNANTISIPASEFPKVIKKMSQVLNKAIQENSDDLRENTLKKHYLAEIKAVNKGIAPAFELSSLFKPLIDTWNKVVNWLSTKKDQNMEHGKETVEKALKEINIDSEKTSLNDENHHDSHRLN